MTLREQLILTGIRLIEEDGLSNFSLRKTAAACGVSCAAPYKHFKDKEEFLLAVFAYINDKWQEVQSEVVAACDGSTADKLTAVSLSYIRFLVDNPQFRSIIMVRDDAMSPEQVRRKAQMTACTRDLIARYCDETGLSPERREVKTFVVRALIYGAALMFDNGELPYTDENFAAVERTIRREFDLP